MFMLIIDVGGLKRLSGYHTNFGGEFRPQSVFLGGYLRFQRVRFVFVTFRVLNKTRTQKT